MSCKRHRINWIVALVCGFTGIASLVVVAAEAEKTPTTAPSMAEFAILTDRNIFLSIRVAPKQRSAVVTPPRVEDVWVVRGVFSRGETYVALCENTSTGATRVAAAGETVAAVEIAAVSLDGVDVQGGDQARRVAVGRTLVGGRAVAAVCPSTPAKAAGNVDTKSILERLRQRRRREMTEQSKSPAQSAGSDRSVKIERK